MALALVERGLVPDGVTRLGIRALLRARLRDDVPSDPGEREAAAARVRRMMADAPVAVATDAANRQHYRVPPRFFQIVLGARLKYSSCYWPEGVDGLDEAEETMLDLTVRRAELRDGQRVLDLGCGWGSLSLWMAERMPASTVVAVSNSTEQRRFIEGRARERGLGNLRVLTADMNDFRPEGRFDRVVSVEMLEHMRNWRALLDRVAGWLEPEGRLFVHVFCHRDVPYFFEDEGAGDWMARHFFTGGMMPSPTLPGEVTDRLEVVRRWEVSGAHYARTARAWLDRLDRRRPEVERIFREGAGAVEASRRVERWRLFFMACEELFGYRDGKEWLVAHALLRPARADR